jgi:hypothetical protein
MIAEADIALATGHLASAEAPVVVEEAREAGGDKNCVDPPSKPNFQTLMLRRNYKHAIIPPRPQNLAHPLLHSQSARRLPGSRH